MDPATHLLTTAWLAGRTPPALLAGLAPDLPFYAAYPLWWFWHQRRRSASSTTSQSLPIPPNWIQQCHFATHSLLGLAMVAWWLRNNTALQHQIVLPWLLHILIDIPSHSRARMAPRLFWPLCGWAYDGNSWADGLIRLVRARSRRLTKVRRPPE